MNLGLTGKVAIVLASSKGLGKATAMELSREGAMVTIVARGKRDLSQAAKEIRAQTGGEVLAISADVSKMADLKKVIDKTVERFGKIDILINNAGGPEKMKFEEAGETDWQKTFDCNFKSVIRAVKFALPYLKSSKNPRIINILSFGVKQPINNLILSNAIRAGIVGLAKTLSTELAEYGITVNNVCPGKIYTDRLKVLNKFDEKKKAGITEAVFLSELSKDVPLKRIGKPEEVGSLIAFLSSEKASYITGTTIQIDGGLTKALF